MIVVVGELRLAPAKVSAAAPHMRAVIEATRKEDGCLLYAFGADAIEPGVFRIVERWRDAVALEAHGKSAHMAAWRATLKEIGVAGREVWAYEAGEGRQI